MTGPIRSISWDGDGKRLCIVGQTPANANTNGKDASACARVFGWDTGVSIGELVSAVLYIPCHVIPIHLLWHYDGIPFVFRNIIFCIAT